MSDAHGTFEHARYSEPRPEHGYCTDDMARVLLVATRQPNPSAAVQELCEISLQFLDAAQSPTGAYRNRMNRLGGWDDQPALTDCWGRSIWGLGTAAAHSNDDRVVQRATAQFDRAARRRSKWPRSMTFAALGAAELLSVDPGHVTARRLLADAAAMMPAPLADDAWPWPEPGLTYANAALPEAMIAAGAALDRTKLQRDGLDLLEWLLGHETVDDHLSVTPAGGDGPGDRRPAFDQQPIEVAALADACARAATVDGSGRWAAGMAAATAWFLGDNDGHITMWDPSTGGCFDGLERGRANLNQGTESTLALISTLQHAQQPVPVPA